MASFPPANSGTWSTGLCGCFQDMNTCCWGMWCPCVLVGRMIEVIDQGATSCLTGGALYCLLESFTGCGALYTCGYRARLRQKFGLPSGMCGDFIAECIFPACTICQNYRELRARGVDPALGALSHSTLSELNAAVVSVAANPKTNFFPYPTKHLTMST